MVKEGCESALRCGCLFCSVFFPFYVEGFVSCVIIIIFFFFFG